MGSVGSDTSSELGMLINNYMKLEAKDSKHKLLKFGVLEDDKGGITFSKGYRNKFVEETDTYKISGYMRFNAELKNALKN